MIIHSAAFIKSATATEHYPEDSLPEIVLAGRSNVGKSSLINSLLKRKNIAHTSGRPGKTQTLNFYLVNDDFYFVDVPGYGYARVSKESRSSFATMIEEYLLNREQLKLVIMLVDFRHTPSTDDIHMYQFLSSYQIPCIVVGTKVDKISKNKRRKHEKDIIQTLGCDPDMFTPYSAVTHEFQADIYDLLDQVVEESK